MLSSNLPRYKSLYKDGLLHDTIPFWVRHAIDTEHGGFLTCLERDGRVFDTDKAVWPQGRMAWMFATLYSEVEPREEWLTFARSGAEFLHRHAFDTDGRMFFHLTRTGEPIRKRRYFFSECFTAIAYAALAAASKEAAWTERAGAVYGTVISCFRNPEQLPAKFTGTRPTRGLSVPMIVLATSQIMRKTTGDHRAEAVIEECIAQIEKYFVKDEFATVMETVAADGGIIDHIDGRLLNPGHAIEAAWFILQEAKHRNCDPRLIALGAKMLDWMWERGWDREHGGIIYFRDLQDRPIQEYWHDMKFWWPQNETIIATLMAWQLTGDEKYLRWHELAHDWAYGHFPDPEFGEWYGYLHRDGRISTNLKGNFWKSAFHLPRMQLLAWQILEEGRVTARPGSAA
ncbi:MAG TPA: AGE family epimerase/isomerase [Terrimicrobiaceae bacterium]|nr:AGE family epimerase/isomerase [Terrimicrobiaceae bacterium]